MTVLDTLGLDREWIRGAVYLGIDQSIKHTGLAFEHMDGTMASTLMPPPKGLDGVALLQWLRGAFRELATLPRLKQTMIEGYSFGSKFHREKLGELGGVIRLEFADQSAALAVAPPTSVKKYTTGSGSGKKSNMIKEVYKVWGHDTNDDNEADAFALCRMARAFHLRRWAEEYQRQALDSVSVLVANSPPPPVRPRICLLK